jgi:hypothetical protein
MDNTPESSQDMGPLSRVVKKFEGKQVQDGDLVESKAFIGID